MNNSSKRKLPPAEPPPHSERRRIGSVVHDDLGNASITWRDAPADLERPVLEVRGDSALSIKNEESFDPYARRDVRTPRPSGGNSARTDLRKLSEWIKMMRELEERKKNSAD